MLSSPAAGQPSPLVLVACAILHSNSINSCRKSHSRECHECSSRMQRPMGYHLLLPPPPLLQKPPYSCDQCHQQQQWQVR